MVALQQVQCLEEVVRTKSFRAAAQVLDISQAAVSGHIARLERELNLTLVTRSPYGAVLTPEGGRIMPHLRALAASFEQIAHTSERMNGRGDGRNDVRDPGEQSLTIVGETRRLRGMIPKAIAQLSTTFENITLRVESITEELEMADALRVGHAELGIYSHQEGMPALADDIESVPFFRLGPAGVCLPAGHRALSASGPIEARDLLGEQLVILDEPKMLDAAARIFPDAAHATVSLVDDIEMGLHLVQRGMGLMIISGITAHLADRHVAWRGIAGTPSHTVCLARVRGHQLSPVASAFAEFVTSWGTGCERYFHYEPETGTIVASTRITQWVVEEGDQFSLAKAPGETGR